MECINVTKDYLSKAFESLRNNDVQELNNIYKCILDDKYTFSSYNDMVHLLYIVLEFKWSEFSRKHSDVSFFASLSNYRNEDDVKDILYLFEKIDLGVFLAIVEEDDSIPEQIKVRVVEMYSLFLFLFFRHIRCLEKSENGLVIDPSNPTLNFFRASLVDLCLIVNHSYDYEIALENYRQTLLNNIDSSNSVKFDNQVVSAFCSKNRKTVYQNKLIRLINLDDLSKEKDEAILKQFDWSEEKDYYLINKLFLNPLNSYGSFLESAFEEFIPLDLEDYHLELFNEIVLDYKFCRKKVYEYDVKHNVSDREMCSFYGFMYSIYDKIAYLLKYVYSINIDDDSVSFTKGNLFDAKYNNTSKNFYKLNNPILIPLYFEFQSVRKKNKYKENDKYKKIRVGTFELNEFRNSIEHKSTLFSKDNLLINSKILIKHVRDLIIEAYFLLSTAKANLKSDDLILLRTGYVDALLFNLNNRNNC